jgi:hypothetical protein
MVGLAAIHPLAHWSQLLAELVGHWEVLSPRLVQQFLRLPLAVELVRLGNCYSKGRPARLAFGLLNILVAGLAVHQFLAVVRGHLGPVFRAILAGHMVVEVPALTAAQAIARIAVATVRAAL